MLLQLPYIHVSYRSDSQLSDSSIHVWVAMPLLWLHYEVSIQYTSSFLVIDFIHHLLKHPQFSYRATLRTTTNHISYSYKLYCCMSRCTYSSTGRDSVHRYCTGIYWYARAVAKRSGAVKESYSLSNPIPLLCVVDLHHPMTGIRV